LQSRLVYGREVIEHWGGITIHFNVCLRKFWRRRQWDFRNLL